MGFLQRISVILRSNINDLISRAEDPEKTLNQAIDDMQKQMAEARKRVAAAIADEKRLSRKLEDERSKTEEWEKKAMAAVRASRDDLAVEALAKKKQHEAITVQFTAQLADQQLAVEGLKEALDGLSRKIDEAKRQRTLLVARVQRAEAQKAIAETLSLTNDRSALASFERMAEKVDRIEAEAEARVEVAAFLGENHGDKLSREIRLLEAHSVDDDLLALKAKMKAIETKEKKQLGAGEAEAAEDADGASPSEA